MKTGENSFHEDVYQNAGSPDMPNNRAIPYGYSMRQMPPPLPTQLPQQQQQQLSLPHQQQQAQHIYGIPSQIQIQQALPPQMAVDHMATQQTEIPLNMKNGPAYQMQDHIPGSMAQIPTQPISMYQRQIPTPFVIQEQQQPQQQQPKPIYLNGPVHPLDHNMHSQQQQQQQQQQQRQQHIYNPQQSQQGPAPPQQQMPMALYNQIPGNTHPVPSPQYSTVPANIMNVTRMPINAYAAQISEYVVDDEYNDPNNANNNINNNHSGLNQPGRDHLPNNSITTPNGYPINNVLNIPNSKSVRNSKRAVQNRNAQKAFRMRKERYIRLLESKSRKFDELMKEVQRLKLENMNLKNRIWELEGKLKAFTENKSEEQQQIQQQQNTVTAVIKTTAQSTHNQPSNIEDKNSET